ncbi:hypothetical protein PV325_010525 [Microctonus aethiopoides]|nr:hypothetical protein PV325_010525 [Microctonus aethiopoides]
MAQNNHTVGDGTTQGASGADNTLYRTANQTNANNDLKSFLKYVPNFDGTEEGCTTRAFIICCEKTREFLPQTNEENIVFALMSKFKGRYAAKIIEEKIKTIDNLIAFIRSQFESPPVPYTDRIVNFKSFRQGHKEKVAVYGNRVKDLLCEIVDEINQSEGDNKEEREKFVTEMAVSGFLKGLRPQYVRLLKKMKFEKLTFAIKEAIEAETLCNEFPNLAMENNAASCFNVQHERKQNAQLQDRNNKNCNYCNRTGHEWSECRVRKRDNDSKYGNDRNVRNVNQQWNSNRNNYNNRGNNNINNSNNIPSNNRNQNNRNNRGSNNQYTDNNRSNNSNYQNNRSNANKNHRQNSQNNSSNRYNIQCSYCHKLGHIAIECRKRIYEEQHRQNGFPALENNRPSETQPGNEQGAPRSGAPTGNTQ